MFTPNGRINKRKTVQFMIGLTIIAWATQTLLHQWGFGAEVTAATMSDDASARKIRSQHFDRHRRDDRNAQ